MATVKELREEAKKFGIKGYSKMRKAELEAAILEIQAMQEHINEEENETFKQLTVEEKLKDLYTDPDIVICKLDQCTEEEIREIAEMLGYEPSAQSYIEKVVDFIVYEIRTQLKVPELQKLLARKPKPEKLNNYLRDHFTHDELQHLMEKYGLEFQLSSGTSELTESLTKYYTQVNVKAVMETKYYTQVNVKAVMEQLQAVGADHEAQRGILRKLPENFLKEMAEVVNMKWSHTFWRMPMKGRKKYYLDMLTHVYKENLPTEILTRKKAEILTWLTGIKSGLEYLAQWKKYLAG